MCECTQPKSLTSLRWINEEFILREVENEQLRPYLHTFLGPSLFHKLCDGITIHMASSEADTHDSHYAGEFWLIQDLHKACVGP